VAGAPDCTRLRADVLLSLAESAANECIRLSYEIHAHYKKGVGDERSPDGREWYAELQRLNQALEEQALRFHDKQIRDLLDGCTLRSWSAPSGLETHRAGRRGTSRSVGTSAW
jgi:hypothetical protein